MAVDRETNVALSSSSQSVVDVLGRYFGFIAGLWRSSSAMEAWLITIVVIVSQLATIWSQILQTEWNKGFFDALGQKSMSLIGTTVGWLPFMLALIAISNSVLVVSTMALQLLMRKWSTGKLVSLWMSERRYYRLNLFEPDLTVPEFRIASDLELAIDPLVNFVFGLASALITGVAFASILWHVGGSIEVEVWGQPFEFNGYMTWAALLYSIIASIAIYYTGRPLVSQVAARNEVEASFRAEATAIREHAESIVQSKGGAERQRALHKIFLDIVQLTRKIITQNGVIALVLNTNNAISPLFPLLLATPKYMAGQITLGDVMQLVAAFGAVQGALMWFVNNFVGLATWYASVKRVQLLLHAFDDLDAPETSVQHNRITREDSPDDRVHVRGLTIADRDGTLFVRDCSFSIEPGDKILITGKSGSGKSVFLRALTGFWPFGSGEVLIPAQKTTMFITQTPYIPEGTLHKILIYPSQQLNNPDLDLKSILKHCDLGYLYEQLDFDRNWVETLSTGERQRVAFARLLIQKPDIIALDNALSNLDAVQRLKLLSTFDDVLSQSTIICVDNLESLHQHCNHVIELDRTEQGAKVTLDAIG